MQLPHSDVFVHAYVTVEYKYRQYTACSNVWVVREDKNTLPWTAEQAASWANWMPLFCYVHSKMLYSSTNQQDLTDRGVGSAPLRKKTAELQNKRNLTYNTYRHNNTTRCSIDYWCPQRMGILCGRTATAARGDKSLEQCGTPKISRGLHENCNHRVLVGAATWRVTVAA